MNKVVRAIQTMLKTYVPSANIKADGIFGPATARGICALKPADRQAMMAWLDTKVSPFSMVSQQEVLNMVKTVNSPKPPFLPLPDQKFIADCAKFALNQENIQGRVKSQDLGPDLIMEFPEYIGTFRGLFQFNQTTWDAVSNAPFPTHFDKKVGLPAEVRAYCALVRSNRDQILRAGFEVSPAIMYLAHNQGAPAAIYFLKTGKLRYPRQSAAALAVFKGIKVEKRSQNSGS